MNQNCSINNLSSFFVKMPFILITGFVFVDGFPGFLFPVPPKIDYEDKYNSPLTQKAGSILLIHVTISGVPTPTVSWYCGDTVLVAGDNVNIETTDTYSTLTIKGVKGTHSATYTVKAENVVDTASAEFTVTITGMDTQLNWPLIYIQFSFSGINSFSQITLTYAKCKVSLSITY